MPMVTKGGALLAMGGVHFAFSGKPALQGVTFSVQQGEIFGFLGPSGAGKTTTIKILTRQLRADQGDVHLFGEPIKALKQQAFDQIGVLSDNSGLYDRLSVYENLKLYADINRLPRGDVDALLGQIGLADDAKKPAKALSRGMRQRVMLARAVLHKPRLLFLDEPTAALDPGTAQMIHQMLRTLNEGGTTIFLTTHNMEEADKLCDRVAFLNHGQIVAMDTPEAFKLKYAKNEIVAKLESGKTMKVEKTADGMRAIADAFASDKLLTLHSQEPNLEEIFLGLTGRNLA